MSTVPDGNEESGNEVYYAQTAWTWLDVQELRPSWTRDQCDEFLQENEKYIRNAMIEAGNVAIKALLV